MGFDPPLALLVPLQILHALTFGAAHLGAIHVMARSVPEGQAGTAQALYASVVGGVGMGAAMLLAGPLYAAYGGRAYWAMAVIAAVGLAASVALLRLRGARRLLSPRAEARAGATSAPVVAQAPAARSRASSSGPVEVDPVGALGDSSMRRRHRQRGRHHAADHDLEAARARAALASASASVEPAGLVELDVDGIVARRRARRGRRGRAATSSAHTGTGRGRCASAASRAGRQRLLDQLDAGLGRDRHQLGQQLRRPGLVGVGDQARSADRPRRTWRMRSASPAPPSLIFRSGMASARPQRPWPPWRRDRRG